MNRVQQWIVRTLEARYARVVGYPVTLSLGDRLAILIGHKPGGVFVVLREFREEELLLQLRAALVYVVELEEEWEIVNDLDPLSDDHAFAQWKIHDPS